MRTGLSVVLLVGWLGIALSKFSRWSQRLGTPNQHNVGKIALGSSAPAWEISKSPLRRYRNHPRLRLSLGFYWDVTGRRAGRLTRSGVFDAGLFAAVTLVVMVTTFVAPPLQKAFSPPAPLGHVPPQPEGIEDLATSA
jgi:hypothetical protein